MQRQLVLSTRLLRLYVRAGEHSPDVPLSPPEEHELSDAHALGRPSMDRIEEEGRLNASASAGELVSSQGREPRSASAPVAASAQHAHARSPLEPLEPLKRSPLARSHRLRARASQLGLQSVSISYPPSQWLHLLVYGADVEADEAEYDVRVEVESGASEAAGSAGATARQETLAASWRYHVDPQAGRTNFDDWVVLRHMHPSSGDTREYADGELRVRREGFDASEYL